MKNLKYTFCRKSYSEYQHLIRQRILKPHISKLRTAASHQLRRQKPTQAARQARSDLAGDLIYIDLHATSTNLHLK